MATSYTVQQSIPDGETHALRWEGDTITGISDAFTQQSIETMSDFMLPHVEYHPYQGDPAGLGVDGFVAWQPPMLEWETPACEVPVMPHNERNRKSRTR